MFQDASQQARLLRKQKKNIKEALLIHLEGLKNDGLPSPEARSKVDYIAVS